MLWITINLIIFFHGVVKKFDNTRHTTIRPHCYDIGILQHEVSQKEKLKNATATRYCATCVG